MRPALPLLLLAACRPAPESDPVVDCGTNFTPYPYSGQQGVFYRTAVEASFLPSRDPIATIAVDGVAGSTVWRHNTLVFTPDEPLAPLTTYTATVTFECVPDGASWSFTTSAAGAPVDPATLVGRTYAIELARGQFVEPQALASYVQIYLPEQLLLTVTDAEASKVGVMLANGADDAAAAQDTCWPTSRFDGDFSQAPFFDVRPAGEPPVLAADHLPLTLQRARLTGAFGPDGATIEGGVLTGSFDTRPLVPLVGDASAREDAICGVASTFGSTCVACPDGSGAYCLPFEARFLEGTEVIAPIVEIPSHEQACARPECADAPACTGG
jgi:hypothetical protein